MIRKGKGVIDRKRLNELLGIPEDAVIISFKNDGGFIEMEYHTTSEDRTLDVDFGNVRRHRLGEGN